MPDALFDTDPAALVYLNDSPAPMHKMRCRECHKRKPVNGGGGGGGIRYAVCDDCFRAPGRLGDLARRPSVDDRDLIVAHD